MLDMRGLYSAFTGQDRPQALPGVDVLRDAAGLSRPVQQPDVRDDDAAAPRLVRLLEKRARDLGVDLRWGHELTGLQPDEDGVALSVATPPTVSMS